MAAIKGNSVLKWGVPILLLVVGVFALRACQQSGGDSRQASNSGGDNSTRNLTPAEKKAIGVGSDSPDDTVATLVAKVRQMRKELKKSQQQSAKLRDQNERLANKNEHVESTVNQALAEQRRQQNQQNRSMMSGLKDKLAGLKAKLSIDNDKKQEPQQPSKGQDMPVGLGVTNGQQPAGATGQQMSWVKPLGGRGQSTGQGGGDSGGSATQNAAAQGGSSSGGGTASAFETAFQSGAAKAESAAEKAERNAHVDAGGGNGTKDNPGTPVYTVPKNATLVGSVAMSALLGRVPRDGQVQNPYPFKIVIGPDNLTANGIELPQVKGAIVSGTAVGDWTLSCVRGTIKSITFVFADGRTEVVPESDRPSEGGKNDDKNRDIGYISNPAGVPCVPGKRKTNARKFIMTNLLLSAGQGAANAVAGGETTTSVNGLGATRGVTGNTGKYIAGRAASQGMKQVRKWFNKRFSSTFDAVYVPPGHKVAVNIDKTLPINYDPNGRKVHDASLHHDNGLD
ncbi:TIGR03752 family integrating conjugative element protein [Salinisphaera orenii]|uniref:TIGR03752 family integrating conjugative element protein n=1 Tax=Salinisphaera orenii TaxID=856731 RepID=UPI000DBE4E91